MASFPSNANVTLQFPLTHTDHLPRSFPFKGCSPSPGSPMSRGSTETSRRPSMSLNRSACLAWMPLRVPATKNRCNPLCRTLRIATGALVTHGVTPCKCHNVSLNRTAGRAPRPGLASIPPDTSVVRLHAMTRRVLWLAPLVTVTALLAVWVAAPSVYRFFAIDSCLDSGGAWDYGRNGCLHSNR